MRRVPLPLASILVTVVVAALCLLPNSTVNGPRGAAGTFVSPALAASFVPDYAPRGRLAMAEAKRRYPDASIIDFEYAGRSNQSLDVAEDTFMMWLLQQGRERGLKVGVTFHKSTQKVIAVRFQDTYHSSARRIEGYP